ncbi:hypothetical protein CROQUDRAFT_419043 [Cronartium quercuum f. sp. fusiforme G11]|uniref:Uncharacterized protein n=1 Tax=Cronartium quercuum f. sp. fusiforme G11 TaxID=708437 RepID=A0A9P6TDY3_9BASI|nr:hypothetical protein CROQUDRAFT_419043 [Cronartium quercuum f. sp. fusiforme G11]
MLTADKASVEHFFENCVIQTRFGQYNPEWPKLILVPAIFNSRIPVSQQRVSHPLCSLPLLSLLLPFKVKIEAKFIS